MADHDLRNGEHSGTCCEVANPIDAQDDADVALSVPSSIGQAPSEALNRADRQGAQKPRYVLIADDDRGIMDALALIVAEVGFTPLTASDGRQALALSRQTRPDLVITDLRMPYLDGASLIAALHADAEAQGRRAPPIILMTALTHLPEHTIIADALLLKPFDMMALIDLLQRLLPPLL